MTAFGDPRSLTIHDPDHSAREDRFILLGKSLRARDENLRKALETALDEPGFLAQDPFSVANPSSKSKPL